jgi:hypothetical protein
MYRIKRTRKSNLKAFDPNDSTHVKHTRIGVWDIYEERQSTSIVRIPGFSEHFRAYNDLKHSLPYFWRMIKDISTIDGCIFLIVLYVIVELLGSLIPAISLW